jgi:hypothetical protein
MNCSPSTAPLYDLAWLSSVGPLTHTHTHTLPVPDPASIRLSVAARPWNPYSVTQPLLGCGVFLGGRSLACRRCCAISGSDRRGSTRRDPMHGWGNVAFQARRWYAICNPCSHASEHGMLLNTLGSPGFLTCQAAAEEAWSRWKMFPKSFTMPPSR